MAAAEREKNTIYVRQSYDNGNNARAVFVRDVQHDDDDDLVRNFNAFARMGRFHVVDNSGFAGLVNKRREPIMLPLPLLHPQITLYSHSQQVLLDHPLSEIF